MEEKKDIVIAVHIVGQGLQCAAVDLKAKTIVSNTLVTAKVDKNASNRHIIPSWSMNIKKILSMVNLERVRGIGFAIPGPFDYANGIADFSGVSKFSQLKGLNISKELNRRLMLDHDLEIRYVNDAVGFSIGQNWNSISNFSRELVLIIDSGFGSCFMVNGLPAFDGVGIPAKGSLYAKPFKGGIADDFFSIRGVFDSLAKEGSPVRLTNEGTIQAVYGSSKGQEVLCRFGSDLGDFITPFITDFKPDSLSLGGLIGSHSDLFIESLRETLATKINGFNTPIQSGNKQLFLLGAARLFEDDYWPNISPLLTKME